MSIIIRLQNLPLEANSLDIRRFFQSLHIPDGGVHIVGGDNGDAFIAFATDEDARQAMGRNGNMIKGSRINLLLSSRTEMQRVIDNARTQTFGVMNVGKPAVAPVPPSPVVAQNTPSNAPPPPYQFQPTSAAPMPSKAQMSPQMKSPIPYTSSVYNTQAPPPQQPTGGPPINSSYSNVPAKHESYPRNPMYQRRSRSRSRSPKRTDLSGNSNNSSSANMHSGLIGSIQSSYPQNDSYSQTNTNNGQSGYDNSNMPPRDNSYYSRSFDSPNYDNRWGSQQSNPPPPSQPVAPPPVNQSNPPASDNYWPPSSRDDTYRKVDSGSGQYGQMSSGQSYGSNEPPMSMPPNQQPQPQQQQQSIPPPTQPASRRMFTLQVWNLPPSVRSRDLIDFFRPLYLTEENIQLFYDEKGFPTGIALVRFPTPREFDTALGYSGKYMQDRQVSIRPLDEMNGSNLPPPTLQQQAHVPPANPASYNQQDSYNSYRDSPNQSDNYNRPPLPSAPAPYHSPPQQRSSGGPNQDLVVFMKGLPFNNCTQEDVANFFMPLSLANIEIQMDNRGKPTGNAYVEFKHKQDFDRGMEYNLRHMGRRYIELIPLSKLDKFGPPSNRGPPSSQPPPYSANSGRANFCIRVKGLSPNVTSQDLKMYFGDFGARPYAVHIMLTPDQRNAGEAFLEFVDKDLQEIALKRDGDYMGHDRLLVHSVPYELVMETLGQPPPGPPPPPPQHGPPPGRPDYYRGDSKGRDKYSRDKERGNGATRGGRHTGSPLPPRNGSNPFQDKPCIVNAYNISLKATKEDLAVFFADFQITPDRVRLRMDDRQKALEGQIAFYDWSQASHACRTMDKKFFLNRYIHLKQVYSDT